MPWELIDRILIQLNSSLAVIELDRLCILKKIPDSKPTTKWAIENGKFNYLKWIHELERVKTRWSISNPLVTATCSNYFDVLKFWHENVDSLCSFPYLDYASSAGHLNLVIYLNSINVRATTDAMDLASCRGHIDVVKYLSYHREEGCTSRALNGSAKNGHLRVVKFLVGNRGEKITAKTLQHARAHRYVYEYLVNMSRSTPPTKY